jgi:hypothetical protein
MLKHDLPRKPKGFDFRDEPEDMDSIFLLNLSNQVYARAAKHNCTEETNRRSLDLTSELSKRLGEHRSTREAIRILKRDLKHAELIIQLQKEELHNHFINYIKIRYKVLVTSLLSILHK